MSELELYKFVNDNNIEFSHHQNDRGVEDVLMFVNFGQLAEFGKMISWILEDGGIEVIMKETYMCFWMSDICENCDIEINNVFPIKGN